MVAQRGIDVARYLRNSDPSAMWNDAQDLMRGRTWIVAGAGFLGGLAIARAVRTATGEYEYRDQYAQPGSQTGYST
jgi:hypothetical protein